MAKTTCMLEGDKIKVCLEGEILFEGKSAYQQIKVIQTERFGKILLLDDIVQLSENDESFYHESFVHPVMALQANPRSVLIIGGGDGGTLREVLKHPIDKVVMVEIDLEAMQIMRKHLPIAEEAFCHPKAKILVADGKKYIEQANEVFDVILFDLTDPTGPSVPLFTKEFYKIAKRKLTKNGSIVVQGNSPITEPHVYGRIATTLKALFKNIIGYCTYIPSFFVPDGFLIASDNKMERLAVATVLKQRGISLKSHNPEQVQGLLSPCPYCGPVLQKEWKDSSLQNPTKVWSPKASK